MIREVKNTVTETYVISDHNCEEIVGIICEKKLQKTSQTEFRIEKSIRKKFDNHLVK